MTSPQMTEQQWIDLIGSMQHVRADKGRSGIYHGGTYRLVTPQPDEAILRATKLWQDWALDQFEHREEAAEGVDP